MLRIDGRGDANSLHILSLAWIPAFAGMTLLQAKISLAHPHNFLSAGWATAVSEWGMDVELSLRPEVIFRNSMIPELSSSGLVPRTQRAAMSRQPGGADDAAIGSYPRGGLGPRHEAWEDKGEWLASSRSNADGLRPVTPTPALPARGREKEGVPTFFGDDVSEGGWSTSRCSCGRA
jgi:hypothetical protein